MIKEYEQFVQSRKNKDYATISSRLNDERTADLLHAVLGVASELMELHQATDKNNELEECGDVLFFATLGLEACGSSLTDVINEGIVTTEQPTDVTDPLDALKSVLFKGKSVDAYLPAFKRLFVNTVKLVITIYDLHLLMESNRAKLNTRHSVQENYEEESANRNIEEEREIMTKFLTTTQGDNV